MGKDRAKMPKPLRRERMNLHKERLLLLKRKGFCPQVIYDIGAFRGEWAQQIQEVFTEARFFLFEANAAQEPFLKQRPFIYFIALLGEEDKMATFYAINSTGDSLFRENSHYYHEGKEQKRNLPMTTLNTLVEKESLALPDLVKIDVQGAEKRILQGAKETLCHAEAIILETKILEYNAGAPLIYEIVDFMQELGYQILDILEHHYLPSGELNEIDLLFVRKNSFLIKKGILL